MPKVRFGNHVVECEVGENLRKVLMREGLPLYHPLSRAIHCRGLGTCGTCAVKLRGSASWPEGIEQLRLRIPPHKEEAGLRLACQCQVQGDLVVEKFGGIWGQKLDEEVSFKSVQQELPSTKEDVEASDSVAHREESKCSERTTIELSGKERSETVAAAAKNNCFLGEETSSEKVATHRPPYQAWRPHRSKVPRRAFCKQAIVSQQRRQRFTSARANRNRIRPK